MKYYAVTDDPNELMHYGIKGMKWGIIRTDAQLGHPKKPSKPRSTKPKSPAYMKAAAKLSSAMQNGIAKAQASWKVYNSPANKQLRAEKREYNKAVRDYKRGERLFEKHVQLARQGRLKYKGISDGEVQRITDRLALENRARQQSGNEKQSFRRRLGESIGQGIISGVGQGMSVRASEWVGRGSKLKTQRLMTEQQNRLREEQERRDFNRSMHEERVRDRYHERRDVARERRDVRREYHRLADEEGIAYTERPIIGFRSTAGLRQEVRRIKQQRAKEEAADSLEDYKERQKIAAKYKKGGKKNSDGEKDSKPDKPEALPEPDKPAALPAPSSDKHIYDSSPSKLARPLTDSERDMISLGLNRSIMDSAAQKGRARNRARMASDIAGMGADEDSNRSTEYWARIHEFNEATRRANERKAAQEDAARAARLREEGFAEREARRAYKTTVSDWAREKSNMSGARRTSGVKRYGSTYETEAPLFSDEERRLERENRERMQRRGVGRKPSRTGRS